jgi:ribulose-bisphosphate carboxylase large chain
MPVFSSGQTALQAHGTWAALKSPDLIFAAGGGIMAHPDGPAAGVRALHDAWSAAMNGIPLAQAAKDSPALAAAVRAYG